MRVNSSVSRNTVLNLLGYVFPIFVAIWALPLAIKYFGEARFGVLSLAWLVIGSSTIFDLGMGRATTKFVAEAFGLSEFQRIPRILSSALCVQLFLGISAGAVMMAITPFLIDRLFSIPKEFLAESQNAFFFAGISIPIVLVSSSYRGLFEASHRFDITNIFRVIFSSLTYLSPVIAMYFSWDLGEATALLIGFHILQVVSLHLTCLFVFPDWNWMQLLGFDASLLRKMFGFGGWVALSNFLSFLQENAERLLLAALLPISLLTYYAVPKDVLDRVYILPSSLTAALFPLITVKSISNKEEVIGIFSNALKIIALTIGLILFCFALLAGPIFSFWINEEFSRMSAEVVLILVFGVMASSFNLLAMITFQASNRPDITAKQQLIRTPILLVVAWFLILKFGLLGAAASWSFGRGLALAMNCWALPWVLGGDTKDLYSYRNMMAISAFPLAMLVYFLLMPVGQASLDVPLLSFVFIGSLVFMSWFYFFVFTLQERQSFCKALFSFFSTQWRKVCP